MRQVSSRLVKQVQGASECSTEEALCLLGKPQRFYRRVRRGTKTYLAPAGPLAAAQRWASNLVARRVVLSPQAHGYVPECSIASAVAVHSDPAVLVCFDLEDFFRQVTEEDVTRTFRQIGCGDRRAAALARLCCYNGRLPKGAPSSPILANAAFTPTDAKLTAVARRYSFRYSRYADDLIFSSSTTVYQSRFDSFIRAIRRVLQQAGFVEQTKKFRVMRPWQRQEALGLVLNSVPGRGARTPREMRRRARAGVHRLRLGEDPKTKATALQGWVSLGLMVDPWDAQLQLLHAQLAEARQEAKVQ